MAIRVYEDESGNNEITEDNPDSVRQAVEEGEDSEHIAPIYLLTDDEDLTYENVVIRKEGMASDNEVLVDYAENEDDFEDMDAGEQEELELSDGDYDTAVEVYRRITATNVEDAFKSENELYHQVQRDDYIK